MKTRKNLAFIGFLAIIAIFGILTFSSCTTTYGVYNRKTPVKERCLLELDDTLYQNFSGTILIGGFWENVVKKNVVSFPAGHHDLLLKYKRRTVVDMYVNYGISSTTVTTTYEVATAEGVPLSYTFEAGHHYYLYGVSDTDGVHIEVKDLGKNTSLFHNGVYTGSIGAFGVHLGSGGSSYVMAGLDFGYSLVFDFGTPLMLSLNGGGDFGVGPGGKYNPHTEYEWDDYYKEYIDYTVYDDSPIAIPLGAFGGLFGHIIIPCTNIRVGAGYGYRLELPAPMENWFYSPFIRGEILSADGSVPGVYFEYYTDPVKLLDTLPPEDFKIFKK